MPRIVSAFWLWFVALVAVVVALRGIVAVPLRPAAIDVAALIGVALLAVPTIRINEQGRLIARVQSLQKGIEASRKALARAEVSDDRRDVHQKSLDQREGSLAAALTELAGRQTRPAAMCEPR